MQNQYPTVLKRKPKQPAVKQGDGEEEFPFNRKTAIFFIVVKVLGKLQLQNYYSDVWLSHWSLLLWKYLARNDKKIQM